MPEKWAGFQPAAGIFLEFGAGTTDTLLVEASEGTVMIHLAQGAAVNYMELNGAAEVTGSGTIERVRINAPGATIEQSPGSVELAEGITAKVAGEEITGEQEKEEPALAAPSTPKVTVAPVKEFIVEDGISIGYVLVKVSLRYSGWLNEPHRYNVTVGGKSLNRPTSEIPYYYGEVLKEQAFRSNVKVTKN